MAIKLVGMPELTSVPDAERPIGRFITDHVLPQWQSVNTYPSFYAHNPLINRALQRQGMQVRPVEGLHAAFLHDGRVEGGRLGRETTLVSAQAAEACSVKSLTRAYWEAAGVPTLDAARFAPSESEAARSCIAAASKPLVVKSDSARQGVSVSFGVSSENFEPAWKKAAESARVPGIGEGVLVEEFCDALNIRFFVVGGEVRAATLRLPLFVSGDGSSTVGQLMEATFAHWDQHVVMRRIRRRPAGRLVQHSRLSLDDVPGEGELHILAQDPNVTLGGFTVDVTARISEDLRELASQATLAIAGLGTAGIDVLTPRLDSAESAVALDANSWASLVMHSYPTYGTRRIIGRPIANQLRARADYWTRPAYSGSMPVAASPEDE